MIAQQIVCSFSLPELKDLKIKKSIKKLIELKRINMKKLIILFVSLIVIVACKESSTEAFNKLDTTGSKFEFVWTICLDTGCVSTTEVSTDSLPLGKTFRGKLTFPAGLDSIDIITFYLLNQIGDTLFRGIKDYQSSDLSHTIVYSYNLNVKQKSVYYGGVHIKRRDVIIWSGKDTITTY